MEKSHLVTQANGLIEARHKHPLTTREQKIVLTVVSMIQPSDEDFQTYEIYIKDFHEMLGLEGREKYTEIKAIVESLMTKVIEIPRKEAGWLLIHWASHVEYKAGEGKIEFAFDPKLKPYLLQLKKAFTSYRLSNILSLKRAYSIRLYELMKKWQHIGKWEISLEELRGKLGVNTKTYNVYGNFKNRALKPAVKELNDKTDVQVDFEEIKKGRKVAKIRFIIKFCKEKEIKVNIPDENNRSQFDTTLFNKLTKLADGYELSLAGFKRIEGIAKKIYNNDHYIEQLERLIEFINAENRFGGVDKPVGLMIYILEDKERLFKEGYDPSIKNIASEVVPDWFKDRNKSRKEEKSPEELEELEKGKREMERLLQSL